MAIKIEISGFDKDFLPVFESLAKSLSQNPILSMFFLIFWAKTYAYPFFIFCFFNFSKKIVPH